MNISYFEEELLNLIEFFTSSVIDFQAKIKKKIISLDEFQKDEIRKLSHNYFKSLESICKNESK